LKSVYSMMPVIQINFFLYQTEAGKIECGNRQERGREREEERSTRQSEGENQKWQG
jgi:hypothetical protein